LPKEIFPKATSQVTISPVATSQMCKIPKRQLPIMYIFPNDNFPSGLTLAHEVKTAFSP